MTTSTRPDLQILYERAAREFAKRVLEDFGDQIRSVILYGSVARRTAGENSDIDVLVLRSNGRPDRDEMIRISEAIDFENNFRTFLIATGMTPQRLEELSCGGFPIASAIFRESEVLYDDGTFERLREKALGEG